MSTHSPTPQEVLQSLFGLTAKEAEIAMWLAGGKTNWEIGRIVRAGERTVEKHVERILWKLRTENRTGAAVMIALANRASDSA